MHSSDGFLKVPSVLRPQIQDRLRWRSSALAISCLVRLEPVGLSSAWRFLWFLFFKHLCLKTIRAMRQTRLNRSLPLGNQNSIASSKPVKDQTRSLRVKWVCSSLFCCSMFYVVALEHIDTAIWQVDGHGFSLGGGGINQSWRCKILWFVWNCELDYWILPPVAGQVESDVGCCGLGSALSTTNNQMQRVTRSQMWERGIRENFSARYAKQVFSLQRWHCCHHFESLCVLCRRSRGWLSMQQTSFLQLSRNLEKSGKGICHICQCFLVRSLCGLLSLPIYHSPSLCGMETLSQRCHPNKWPRKW